jgi:hypothetical protein
MSAAEDTDMDVVLRAEIYEEGKERVILAR